MDKVTKEERQKEKQKAALEAKLNKELIIVPKATTASMKILAVDSKGLFKMLDNRWARMMSLPDVANLPAAVGKMPCRMRLTSLYSEEQRQDFLTLVSYSESITDTRKMFDEACEVLRSAGVIYTAMDADKVMNTIAGNYGIKEPFSLTSAVRKKKSFKDLVTTAPDSEEEDTFLMGETFGSAYFAMILDKGFSSPFSAMAGAGLSFATALDIAPMKGRALMDYKKLLEAHYDRQVSSVNDGKMVNVSLYILSLSESEEARETIESIMYRLFPENGITISPLFGLQRQAEESIMTLGLIDSTYMRMLSVEEAKTLI